MLKQFFEEKKSIEDLDIDLSEQIELIMKECGYWDNIKVIDKLTRSITSREVREIFNERYYILKNEEDIQEQIQDKKMRAENRSQLGQDLPVCIDMLSKLEYELESEKGILGKWMEISYNLNSDFEDTLFGTVKEICESFLEAKQQYGVCIAQSLYNTQTIILSSEILPAACYLKVGGKVNDLEKLAYYGVFMSVNEGSINEDKLKIIAEYMAQGGSADSVFEFLDNQKEQNSMDIS